jgi:CheY-like chemotaxis protein
MLPFNHTILCVDDDEDDMMILHESFSALGTKYQIDDAFDGLDALNKLMRYKERGELPCLIVLDINMPKLDGKQTVIAIQSDPDLVNIPIVIFTTSSSKMDQLFCTSRHVVMMTKPIDFRTFHATAKKMLEYCKV